MHGITIEDRPEGVRVLTLANARRRNALDEAMLDQLDAALDVPETTRALLLRGHGHQAFCAGYDLTSLGHPEEGGALPDDRLMRVLEKLEQHPLPTVALVIGAAFGAGCDLAAACDLRVGSESAFFCLPPAKLGVVYAEGGLARTMRLVGVARAKWMFLTGRRVESARALSWGLLDELVASPEEAEAAALSLCSELAANAPLAVRGMKAGIHSLSSGAFDSDRHRLARRSAYLSDDAKEGRAAFLSKRPPVFEGK